MLYQDWLFSFYEKAWREVLDAKLEGDRYDRAVYYLGTMRNAIDASDGTTFGAARERLRQYLTKTLAI
jgi:hypothetical protein